MIRDNGINYMESLSSIELNNIFNNKYRGNTPLVLYANGGSWDKLSMKERYNYIHNNYDILANGGTLDDIKRKFAEDEDIVVPADKNIFSSGGSIHIKPENRGKFTALKKRTGHSASWFKAHGTPAQRKMATFALNARKWKHGEGGNLFLDGGEEYNTRKVGLDDNGVYHLPWNVEDSPTIYDESANNRAFDFGYTFIPEFKSVPSYIPEKFVNRVEEVPVITNEYEDTVSEYTDRFPSKEKKNNIRKAINYALDYYYSPGFNERLRNLPNLGIPDFKKGDFFNDSGWGTNLYKKRRYPFNDKYPNSHPATVNYSVWDDGASYMHRPVDWFNFGNDDMLKTTAADWLTIAGHEAGHMIDSHLSPFGSEGRYSRAFPIFKKTKSTDSKHDAKPEESYADLFSLRTALFELGIYDSRDTLPFTYDHLRKFKESGKYNRLLENFSDEDIIWMMNNIALNNNTYNGIDESGNHITAFGGPIVKAANKHLYDGEEEETLRLNNNSGFYNYDRDKGIIQLPWNTPLRQRMADRREAEIIDLRLNRPTFTDWVKELPASFISDFTASDDYVPEILKTDRMKYIDHLNSKYNLLGEKRIRYSDAPDAQRERGRRPWTKEVGFDKKFDTGGNLLDGGGYSNISFVPHDYTREENYVEIKPTIPESYQEAERQAREGVKKATREHTLDDFYNNMMEFGLTRGISPRDTQFKGLENNLDNYILINNPESKKTHLRIIPKEVLDSLAYHHGLNPGVPMEVVYGLPEREDEFGGLNLMNIKDRDSLAVLPPFYMFDAWDYMTSPEEDILLAAKRKALGRPVARDELLTEKQEQQVQDIIADTYRRDKKTYDKNPLYNPNMNIYDWAWEWYRQGRYNPGDPDYLNKVTKDGTDIISSPAFKLWWEKEGKYYYLKGKDEEPKGHKRAYSNNAFGGPVFLIANKQFM